jgi:S-adenosylmethionine hydrolase
MKSRSIITLTTDFGYNDWFVGAMKGVILGRNLDVNIVDITHGIPSGNIAAGAFALSASAPYYPEGTIHLAVVDPGVGSQRRAILIQTRHFHFVGPDNGLMSLAAQKDGIVQIRRLDNEQYFVRPVSRTFHGRDIFASVAGHLSVGVAASEFGPEVDSCQRLDWPDPTNESGLVRGQVVYIDRYGNAITNIHAAQHTRDNIVGEVVVRGHSLGRLMDYYEQALEGEPIALIGSCGLLEIAVNKGSAAEMLQIRTGDPVEWRLNG